jgi:Icc-related predicted phosphoesterase
MVSDVHDQYEKLCNMPKGDILLIAGDLTAQGKAGELKRLNTWLDQQDYKHKVLIPGNHDLSFEKRWKWACSKLPAADAILNQELYVANGLKIWGEPRQPRFYDWAFNVPRNQMKEKCWDKVPDDIDVLLTHGPPWGAGDWTSRQVHVGCEAQREYILEKSPRLVVCGHIHPGYGVHILGNTTVVNASVVNEKYQVVNPPVVVDM